MKELESKKSGNPATNRADHLVSMDVQKVYYMMLDGYQTFEIINAFIDQRTDRTIKSWIAKARRLLDDQMQDDRDERIKTRLAEFSNVYKKAIEEGDLRVALEAAKAKAHLCGDNGAINVNMRYQEINPAQIILNVKNNVK